MEKSHKKSYGRPRSGDERFSLFGRKMKMLQGKAKNIDFQRVLGGIASSAYSNYLNGARSPDIKQISSLRNYSGVDLNWLCMDADTRPGPILVHGPGVEKSAETADILEDGSESGTGDPIAGKIIHSMQGQIEAQKIAIEAQKIVIESLREQVRDARAEAARERGRAVKAEARIHDLEAELAASRERGGSSGQQEVAG